MIKISSPNEYDTKYYKKELLDHDHDCHDDDIDNHDDDDTGHDDDDNGDDDDDDDNDDDYDDHDDVDGMIIIIKTMMMIMSVILESYWRMWGDLDNI